MVQMIWICFVSSFLFFYFYHNGKQLGNEFAVPRPKATYRYPFLKERVRTPNRWRALRGKKEKKKEKEKKEAKEEAEEKEEDEEEVEEEAAAAGGGRTRRRWRRKKEEEAGEYEG